MLSLFSSLHVFLPKTDLKMCSSEFNQHCTCDLANSIAMPLYWGPMAGSQGPLRLYIGGLWQGARVPPDSATACKQVPDTVDAYLAFFFPLLSSVPVFAAT